VAAARDQVARVVRDGDTDESLAPPRAEGVARPVDEARPAVTPAPQAPAMPQGSPPAAANAGVEKSGGRRRTLLIGAIALALLAGTAYGVNYFLVGRYHVTTDDAYVRANNTTLGARVAGHIESVLAKDNARVKLGDVIMKIDDGDYRIALDSARARINTQQATIDRIGQQIAAQQSAVDQAAAQLDSAKAGVVRAQADYDRQRELNDRGFASKAVLEASVATREQSIAAVQSAQAAFNAAAAQVDVVKAQQVEAQQQLAELKSQFAKAERDLEFTNVRAPVDGVFANRMVNPGDYVQPGQRLGNVVPLDAVYIDANFKETQVERIKAGQAAKISIDAFSTHKIDGTVESISPASGAVFSLLPPDNATGNFTKIVQRLPVRIRVPAAVAQAQLLRPGMSVIVTVDTKNAPDDPSASLDITPLQ
jgi:membrane fusion protein, multidrug efflux system